MLAVVTVDTEQDIVDPGDSLTSLREAIVMANNLAGADEIKFDFGYDGPATIQLVQGELKLTEAVTIAGPGPELLAISDRRGRANHLPESTDQGRSPKRTPRPIGPCRPDQGHRDGGGSQHRLLRIHQLQSSIHRRPTQQLGTDDRGGAEFGHRTKSLCLRSH